ncbi:Fungal specific transcription factor domain-containing protein [Colletotrichum higginsianum IMI 349063]|uniref:Fungal specific transcription factor domain-containing protein n=1 Tax=Colletotrichum higginsianum (strain IMI 349063) TaxID=759273 RepID=A0A1B7XU94_COLHI|nr:Fungal specific transcription factor domain-containing protein [Colletotrichum higginsianum IMI 349063]OBR03339.1 Fungal specific transcription factor domain-containing protein [Colletotrichum higginsianum IMI 349063]
MPRPPVRPEDRKRSAKACVACRATKKRCDAAQPCRACVNRGVGALCTYPQQSRNRRAHRQPLAESRQLDSTSRDTRERNRTAPLLYRREGTSSLEGDVTSSAGSTTAATSGPRPVMMYTCSGEKVYVGNASAIAFLQYLRGNLPILGPDFTISQGCHLMFEAQAPVQTCGEFADEIDEEEKTDLVQLFLDAVSITLPSPEYPRPAWLTTLPMQSSGLLDLFDESETSRLLVDIGSLRIQNANEDLLCLFMMIAIGAQCRGQPDDARKAFRYFEEARKLSFVGMLSDPTLNTARGFTLMAFYMFGACRRNSAFMYLGVATKAASVMGLHMAGQFQSLSRAERSLRSRIDKSIRLFDVVCSSILGRPTSIAPCWPKETARAYTEPHRTLSVDRACTLATTLNEIVEILAEDSQLGVVRAERFLEKIKDWSKNLSPALRQCPQREVSSSANPQDRQIAIGNIHVACTYYFGIMLTTREFLIKHIMPQLDNGPSLTDISQEDNASPENKRRVADLSDACVDAAVFMSEMCSEALDSRTIMGNMCILKAWLFAAGLILAFSLLAPEVPQSRERAFYNALRVLDFLGHMSPQAAQYHRLLLSFSQAIDTFKTNSPTRHHQPRAPYVERFLSVRLADRPGNTRRRVSAQKPHPDGHVSRVGQFETDEKLGESIFGQRSVANSDRGAEDVIFSLLWDGEATLFPRDFDY